MHAVRMPCVQHSTPSALQLVTCKHTSTSSHNMKTGCCYSTNFTRWVHVEYSSVMLPTTQCFDSIKQGLGVLCLFQLHVALKNASSGARSRLGRSVPCGSTSIGPILSSTLAAARDQNSVLLYRGETGSAPGRAGRAERRQRWREPVSSPPERRTRGDVL